MRLNYPQEQGLNNLLRVTVHRQVQVQLNYPLEQGFSVWGQHVESEQSAELKEAIVRTSEMQPHHRSRQHPL